MLACRAIAARWPFCLASAVVGELRDNGDAAVAVIEAVGCAGLILLAFPSS